MLHLFPELGDSTNIFFVLPSRKSLRRLPSSDLLPLPLDRTMWAHTFLDDRIHRNVAEVADVGLRLVPSLLGSLGKALESHDKESATLRRLDAVIGVHGSSDYYSARRIFIQEVLLQQAGYLHSTSQKGTTSSRESASTRNNAMSTERHTSYPGDNFWERNGSKREKPMNSVKQSENGEKFPGDNFWITQ